MSAPQIMEGVAEDVVTTGVATSVTVAMATAWWRGQQRSVKVSYNKVKVSYKKVEGSTMCGNDT